MIPALTIFLALLSDQTDDDPLAPLTPEQYFELVRHAQTLTEPVDWARTVLSRRSPLMAKYYAERIDKGPHDETRIGVSADPVMAYEYALEIDKAPHPVTRQGVMVDDTWAYRYLGEVECGPEPTLRAKLLQSGDRAQKAVHIAKYVDQRVLPDTSAAVRGSDGYEDWMKEWDQEGTRIDPNAAFDRDLLGREITRILRTQVALGRVSMKAVRILKSHTGAIDAFVDQSIKSRDVARKIGLDHPARILVMMTEGPVFKRETYTHLSAQHLTRPLIPFRPTILELRGAEVRFFPSHLTVASTLTNPQDFETQAWLRLPLGRLPHVSNWTRLDVVESIQAGEFP